MEATQFATGSRSQIDYELVCRAREQGDERAYSDLMQRYHDSIYVMLLRMTNNAAEAEDLTMITFGKAFNSLTTYAPTNAFSTWLFKIAVHTSIDFLRKQRNQVLSLEGMTERGGDEVYEMPIPSDEDNPEENIIRKQKYKLLHDVVKQLKPRYRQLVELRYFEDMSYEEIARALNMPLGTVKIRLYRAHDLLHALMNTKKGDVF